MASCLGSVASSRRELLAASCGAKACPLGTGPGSPAHFARICGQTISQGLSKYTHAGFFFAAKVKPWEL